MPDLVTEDGQLVSNSTDIVPVTTDITPCDSIVQNANPSKLSCTSIEMPSNSLERIQTVYESRQSEGAQPAIETSGLTLPILDDPSKYILEKSNLIKSEFDEVQKSIETPFKMIQAEFENDH